MTNLTKRQRDVLTMLYQYISTEGYPPSFDDLRKLLDVSSNQTITDMFSALEKKGAIKRDVGNARGLSITKKGFESLGVQPLLPLAGISRGGPLTEAVATAGEWQAVKGDVSKLDSKKDAFLIKVHGDSMEGVIWDGDIVLVTPIKDISELKNRDIVLVEYEGETTVKRFIKNGRKYLEPENPKYQPIPIKQGMQIQGKIIARL